VLAAAFGALHLLTPTESAIGALNVAAFALFASFTLRRTGDLWFAIGMHASWDFAQSFLYGVPDSGMIADHSLVQAHLHGPTWLTGGTVGPEGGAFGFIAIAAAFVVFARRA
jgi:CAAX protease family protein